jgi:hypothetical protein
MEDKAIVEMLTGQSHSDDAALTWLAGLIADPVMVEGVNELRRRYAGEPGFPLTGSGKLPNAASVFIDRDRWKAFFFRRRITMSEIGPLMEPERCSGWGSVIGHKGRAGFQAMDELACALDMRVDDLIWEVGTDDERSRLVAYV